VTQVAFINAEHATPTVSYTYDTTYPRVTTMVDGTGTTAYTYKAMGALGANRVASVDGPMANDTMTYDYDELGRITGRANGEPSPAFGRMKQRDLRYRWNQTEPGVDMIRPTVSRYTSGPQSFNEVKSGREGERRTRR